MTTHLHLKSFVEVLPNTLAFVAIVTWIMFAGPSVQTSVKDAALWFLPITVSPVFSLVYHIWHACAIYGGQTPCEFTMFQFEATERTRVWFVRSVMSAGVLTLFLGYVGYLAMFELISNLGPLATEDGSPIEGALESWMECIFGGLGLLLLGYLLCWPIWAVPRCDWKRVRGTYDTPEKEEDWYESLWATHQNVHDKYSEEYLDYLTKARESREGASGEQEDQEEMEFDDTSSDRFHWARTDADKDKNLESEMESAGGRLLEQWRTAKLYPHRKPDRRRESEDM